MVDRAVILGSQEPPPSPPPPAAAESSSGDLPWQTDAAAPGDIMDTFYANPNFSFSLGMVFIKKV